MAGIREEMQVTQRTEEVEDKQILASQVSAEHKVVDGHSAAAESAWLLQL